MPKKPIINALAAVIVVCALSAIVLIVYLVGTGLGHWRDRRAASADNVRTLISSCNSTNSVNRAEAAMELSRIAGSGYSNNVMSALPSLIVMLEDHTSLVWAGKYPLSNPSYGPNSSRTSAGEEAAKAIVRIGMAPSTRGEIMRRLVSALDNENRRRFAADALIKITGVHFGCGSDLQSVARPCDIDRWKQWYHEYSESKSDGLSLDDKSRR